MDENEDIFGDPKTYKSSRIITLRNSLLNKLKFHLSWQNENKKEFEELYNYDLNLVLCRENGDFMPKSTLFNSFSRILKNAELPNLPIHSLRHTHAVLLMEAGWDMKAIQERLGHGSYQITADVYAHISNRIKEKDMISYEDHMSSILDD
ncbi:tyrosine-type recombinase/integrase [Gracilibacillus salitolerans]|uniref:tyrosine-type recombinase/integrase n=1 Tax=Gracilibacillus salitolerans TaxID=2663022 RepID=UPI001E3BE6D0|nr:tyrosine-type recombinase/integrase [Gracilibacillus salitolerans]